MRNFAIALISAAVFPPTQAHAQNGAPPPSSAEAPPPPTLNCADFQQNPDGSWSPLRQVTISNAGTTVTIGRAATVGAGVPIAGLDLAEILNRQCGGH